MTRSGKVALWFKLLRDDQRQDVLQTIVITLASSLGNRLWWDMEAGPAKMELDSIENWPVGLEGASTGKLKPATWFLLSPSLEYNQWKN